MGTYRKDIRSLNIEFYGCLNCLQILYSTGIKNPLSSKCFQSVFKAYGCVCHITQTDTAILHTYMYFMIQSGSVMSVRNYNAHSTSGQRYSLGHILALTKLHDISHARQATKVHMTFSGKCAFFPVFVPEAHMPTPFAKSMQTALIYFLAFRNRPFSHYLPEKCQRSNPETYRCAKLILTIIHYIATLCLSNACQIG